MSASQPEPQAKAGLPETVEPSAARPSWKRRVGFALLNVWLCYHLFAIVICPASVAPATPIVQSAWTWAAGYLQAIYLNHGFHFFAPDPAGSTLVEYTLEFSDGSTRTGRLPDRSTLPRLRYHRHFMVTEFLGNGPEEFRPLVERAIARNLCRQTGAVRVRLDLIYHDTASVSDVLAGKTLNEPGSFNRIALGSFTPHDLAEPYQPPYVAPAPAELANIELPSPEPVENLSGSAAGELLLPPPPADPSGQ